MRQFEMNGQIYKCIEHIILKNFWEYYIVEAATNTEKVKFAYVMGDYPEFGDVYLPELKPYISSRTKDLDIFPPEGGKWLAS
jgi:hypothetical protein